MDILSLCRTISATNGLLADQAQDRLDSLTKPQGSLGRLEAIARQLVAIRGQLMPELGKKAIFTFAGDHGVADEGVSAFPKAVTGQMVKNFLHGGAGINVLARRAGAEVVVVDIGVDGDFDDLAGAGLVCRKVVRGTGNIRQGPAMSRAQAEACLAVGIGLAQEYGAKGFGIFGTGEMGIANTTPSAAITALYTGYPVAAITGRGTGIDEATRAHKVHVVKDALAVNRPDPADPIDVLAKIGGAELGGIAGLVLGAAAQRIPVVVDGFISTAAAMIAVKLAPACRDYLFAAHRSQEIGHRALLEALGLAPLLDLDLRLGEGTGAALAMPVIEAGLAIYREMATFAEAAVAERHA
ncbi:MAG: nicotinate-nucleotide--dimethylbenzimidazole phosphoribosyltransferase [Thermodesulfobacteriota bacterium]